MKKLTWLLTAALFVSVTAIAQNRKINFYEGDLASVMAKAKAEKKPLFVDAYTTWCGPCKWQDKVVFTNDTVADYYNQHFVNYKLDMEKGEGIQFSKDYQVNVFPSLLFLDVDGQMLHRSVGARPPQAFVALGKEANNPEERLSSLDKQYNNGNRKPDFIAKYLKARGGAGMPVTELLDMYTANVKAGEFTSPENWKLIKWYLEDLNSATYNRFVAERAGFAKKYTADSVDQKLLQLHERSLLKAAGSGNAAEFKKAHTDFKNLNLKYKEAAEVELYAQASYYDKMNDVPNYTKTVVKLVETYYLKNPAMLNNFAWGFYEKVDDKAMLQKAESWAANAVKLSPQYPELDTHAAVLYKLGRKADAKKAAERAIAAGKKEGEDVSGTEALLVKINKLK